VFSVPGRLVHRSLFGDRLHLLHQSHGALVRLTTPVLVRSVYESWMVAIVRETR
jgi:hypothetical protein